MLLQLSSVLFYWLQQGVDDVGITLRTITNYSATFTKYSLICSASAQQGRIVLSVGHPTHGNIR